MAFIKPHHTIKCMNLVQASLPMDTGNLRFVGTRDTYSPPFYTISVGGDAAPYFEFLQTKTFFENKYGKSDKENPYYNNFEDVTFTPVFNYLKFALRGQFGGGRYLIGKTMSAQQAKDIVNRSVERLDMGRLTQVYNKYSGG